MSTKITVPQFEVSNAAIEWTKEAYLEKFGSLDDFEENYQLAMLLDPFKASENIHEKMTDYSKGKDGLIDIETEYIKGESFNNKVHWILRMLATYFRNFSLLYINRRRT